MDVRFRIWSIVRVTLLQCALWGCAYACNRAEAGPEELSSSSRGGNGIRIDGEVAIGELLWRGIGDDDEEWIRHGEALGEIATPSNMEIRLSLNGRDLFFDKPLLELLRAVQDPENSNISSIVIPNYKVQKEEIEELARHKNLRELEFVGSILSMDAWSGRTRWPEARKVRFINATLEGNEVNGVLPPSVVELSFVGSGMRLMYPSLSLMPKLSALSFENDAIYPKDVRYLKVPSLEKLRLYLLRDFAKPEVEVLSELSVSDLELYLPKCKGADFEALGRMLSLKKLSLEGNRLGGTSSNELCSTLGKLTALERLNVARTGLNDTCVLQFMGLHELRALDLSGNEISREARDEIGGALPKCVVRVDN